jgi:recombination protein RecT
MSDEKPAQLPALKDRMANLRGMLERAKGSMAMIIPKHVTPERMIKLALVAASRTPRLLECTPESIVQGVMTSSQLGLDIGGPLGAAYLVPYKNKNGKMEAQFIPGYRGLIDLARRSGQIMSIEARVVHEKDIFEFEYGLAPRLRHVPTPDAEPGKVMYAYAVARLKDSDPQVEVMTTRQLDGIRKRSRAANDGPWVTDTEEMYRKTVVRRLVKYLPMSVELATALELEDRAETGEPTAIDVDLVPEQTEPESRVAELKDRLKDIPTSAPFPTVAQMSLASDAAREVGEEG